MSWSNSCMHACTHPECRHRLTTLEFISMESFDLMGSKLHFNLGHGTNYICKLRYHFISISLERLFPQRFASLETHIAHTDRK